MRRVLLPLLLLAASCAQFRPIETEEIEGARDPGVPRFEVPARERLLFRATFGGIPGGEGEFAFERHDDTYQSRATVGTIGLVSLLYGVTIHADAEANVDDLLSRRWSYRTEDGDEGRRVEARFLPEKGQTLSVIREPEGMRRTTLEASGLRDPLTTIYALRRSDLTKGASFTSNMFTEWFVYQLRAVVEGTETVRTPMGSFEAVFVRMDIRKTVEGRPEDEGRGIGIWFSADEDRVPVRIDVDSSIGRVTLGLAEYEKGWPRVSSGRGTPP